MEQIFHLKHTFGLSSPSFWLMDSKNIFCLGRSLELLNSKKCIIDDHSSIMYLALIFLIHKLSLYIAICIVFSDDGSIYCMKVWHKRENKNLPGFEPSTSWSCAMCFTNELYWQVGKCVLKAQFSIWCWGTACMLNQWI